MKKIFLALSVMSTVYSFGQLNDAVLNSKVFFINGGQETIGNIIGSKQLCIILLPSIRNDESDYLLSTIDSIGNQFKGELTLVGVPSYEDGYEDDSLPLITNWYLSKLNTENILILQGMNTRKTSAYQTLLFHWLTHSEENGHYDNDVTGVGACWLISASGKLFATIDSGSLKNAALIQKLLR